ncbi:MAG: four helix bundle protein [Candidatus Aminicenantes bacterium]|nr:four helix bundle protein [Candidatus Aminicenantes bacterium]
MIRGDDIQERLINFAVDIIEITSKLPRTSAGKHIADQLLRSGTSPAPNYAEARGAESTKDFVHKLKIALKELNETSVWLEITRRSNLLHETQLNHLYTECDELRRIIAASFRTAEKKEKMIRD